MQNIRDYDKEPIVIENRHSTKETIIFYGFFIIFNVVAIVFFHFFATSNTINRGVTLTCVISLIILIYYIIKSIKNFKKRYIRIFNNKITFDYFVTHHELKTYELFKNEIDSISWGFYPYSALDENHSNSQIYLVGDKNDDDKLATYLFLPIWFSLSSISQLLFILVNLKIEKYVYLKFKCGVISIPKNDFPDNKNIKFEWKSLVNSHFFGGGIF
jgi:hypothetical protein